MQEHIPEKLSGRDNILKKKPRLKILILGPYRPQEAHERLINVKKHLISKGYRSTKLAEDFELEDKTAGAIFRKSRELMENWGDALFFFFFKEAVDESRIIGVYDEFVTLCESMPEKIERSVVFIDKEIYDDISAMFKGRIECFMKDYDLEVAFLESQEDANVLAEKRALNILARFGMFL